MGHGFSKEWEKQEKQNEAKRIYDEIAEKTISLQCLRHAHENASKEWGKLNAQIGEQESLKQRLDKELNEHKDNKKLHELTKQVQEKQRELKILDTSVYNLQDQIKRLNEHKIEKEKEIKEGLKNFLIDEQAQINIEKSKLAKEFENYKPVLLAEEQAKLIAVKKEFDSQRAAAEVKLIAAKRQLDADLVKYKRNIEDQKAELMRSIVRLQQMLPNDQQPISDDPPKYEEPDLGAKEMLVLDGVQKWEPADIVERLDKLVHIHYRNWSKNYDEWIHIDSDRIKYVPKVVESVVESVTPASAPPSDAVNSKNLVSC